MNLRVTLRTYCIIDNIFQSTCLLSSSWVCKKIINITLLMVGYVTRVLSAVKQKIALISFLNMTDLINCVFLHDSST